MNSKQVANSISHQLKSIKITESTGKANSSKSIKLWQYAFIIGIPSVAALAYFLYRRQQRNATINKVEGAEPNRETKTKFVSDEKLKEEKSAKEPKFKV